MAKYQAVYLAGENGKLKMVAKGLTDCWWSPYIGRRVNERYNEVFDHNGWYYCKDEYEEKDIVVNLCPEVSAGVIKGIKFYKVRNCGGPHGRPQSRDLALSSDDIRAFREQLDVVSIAKKKCTKSKNAIAAEDLAAELIAGVEALRRAIEDGKRAEINVNIHYANVVLNPAVDLVSLALSRNDIDTFISLMDNGVYLPLKRVDIERDPGWSVKDIIRIGSAKKTGTDIHFPILTYRTILTSKPDLARSIWCGQKFERVKACYDAKDLDLFKWEIEKKDPWVDTSVPVFGKMQFKDLAKRDPIWARLIMKTYGFCYHHKQWRRDIMRDALNRRDWNGFLAAVKEYGFEYDEVMAGEAFAWFSPDRKDKKALALLEKVWKRVATRVRKGKFCGFDQWRHVYDAVMEYGTKEQKAEARALKNQ